MSRPISLLLAVVTLLALGGLSVLPPHDAAAAPEEEPALSGKPLLVFEGDHEFVVLEGPRVRQLGGRSFVVGTESANSSFAQARFPGSTLWVPLDRVTRLVEVDEERLGAERVEAKPAEARSVEVDPSNGNPADEEPALREEGRRYFNLLDRDRNGSVTGDEWGISRRLKPRFEQAGVDLSQPMSEEAFVAHYLRVTATGK